jgi:hypothetical protein
MENSSQPVSGTKREKTGGRTQGTPNKATAEVKELAREYGPEAIKRLAYLMRHAKAEQAQAMAAKELLDRGYGKAIQQMEVNTTRFVIRAPMPLDTATWVAEHSPKAGRTAQ